LFRDLFLDLLREDLRDIDVLLAVFVKQLGSTLRTSGRRVYEQG
jgi:hypothetical protein